LKANFTVIWGGGNLRRFYLYSQPLGKTVSKSAFAPYPQPFPPLGKGSKLIDNQ